MKNINVNAYAKLNISLDVLRKNDDGYHALQMVMQSVDLCDDISISAESGNGAITVKTNKFYLPEGEKNIAGKAAAEFLSKAGISGMDIRINIKKRIPVCAGLGGGSADAAAVLRGLNELTGKGFSQGELEELGGRIGSDVPYCIAGGTALAEGRGQILTELPAMPDCFAVICKPAFSVSTPQLFSCIDCEKIKCRPDTAGIIEALANKDLRGIARRVYNVFEDVLVKGKQESIREIKSTLLDIGALGAAMTGTGSAVFGIFDSRDHAEKAYNTLKQKYKECFLAKTKGKISI